ncbi:MAG: type VI secretion system accessory protein TagJ [Planctomycetaceae bacterium]
MTHPVELFQSGKLSEAVTAATEAVRKKPTDLHARSTLCEVLCFAGDLERADKQLDAVATIDPEAMVGASMLRHLIRSEISRREVFSEGRVPELVEKPSEALQKRMQALLLIREGDAGKASALLAEAEELEVPVCGKLNGSDFEGIRDMDDLLGPVLEVFTATGNYYWIPFSQIHSLELDKVTNLTDMLWRGATIEATGDISGRIHIPAIYFGSEKHEDERVRIGRSTEWLQSSDDAPVRGAGQKEFLVGDDAVAVMEIRSLLLGSQSNG